MKVSFSVGKSMEVDFLFTDSKSAWLPRSVNGYFL